MLIQQGSLDCLRDPVALRLLQSCLSAYIACAGEDGARRIETAPFHWDGLELVLYPPWNASTLPALQDGAEVSVSIDSDMPPWSVLLIRGEVSLSASLAPGCGPGVRVRPVWAGMLEFRARADVHPQ